INFFGRGAFLYCARIPGRRGPSPLASSRATMNKDGALSLSADPPGAEPRNTRRSISPGFEAIDASPAAHPPMLAPTTDTVFAPDFRRKRTADRTSTYNGALIGSESPGPFDLPYPRKSSDNTSNPTATRA